MPTAVGAFVMANQYGRHADEPAAATGLTSIVSILPFSAVLIHFT